MSNVLRKVGASPFGFWLGPKFIIYFADADDAETIFNHPSTMDKGGMYEYIEDGIGGKGLLSAGGVYIYPFSRNDF